MKPALLAAFALLGCMGEATTSGTTTGGNFTATQQHNLNEVNRYRATAGARSLALDGKLTQFAQAATEDLANGGMPHAYFQRAGDNGTLFSSGFCGAAGENQGPGWPLNPDESGTIDAILKSMMDEGPGGGHHDNILDARWAILGVGVVVKNGRLSMTNDFSPGCR